MLGVAQVLSSQAGLFWASRIDTWLMMSWKAIRVITLRWCMQESVPSEVMTFNMAVSVLWAAYNSIPPLLLLHFAFLHSRATRACDGTCASSVYWLLFFFSGS